MAKMLNEICKNCGLTYESHHAGRSSWPYDCCPGHEGRMDWDKGPGTVFETSCKYKDIPHGTPANGRKEDD